MAFKIIEQGRKPNTIWHTYVCDTNDDVADLPTDAPAGSRALVAKNGDLYLLDSTGAWNPMPRGGGGGGGGGDVEANPALTGSEADLNGLKVGDTSYIVRGISPVFYGTTSISFDDLIRMSEGSKEVVLIDNENYHITSVLNLTSSKINFWSFDLDNSSAVVYRYTIGDPDPWNKIEIPFSSLSFLWCTPNSTSFSEIVESLNNGRVPVIAAPTTGTNLGSFFLKNIEYSGDDPVAIEFSTIGSGTKYTWRVDPADVWQSGTESSSDGVFWVEPNSTSFLEIVGAIGQNRMPVINDLAGGRAYYVSGYSTNNGDPVAIRFCTLEKDDSGLRYTWTVDYQDNWTSGSYTDGLYYVVPGTTTFMDIVGLLTKCTQPVINDTVNGRAYYISDYTMVGGQPAAITFSTIGANTPHTWTVDYQDNWTST